MKMNVCTISFRHQLISMKDIALWSQYHQFHGIELWGVHAKNMNPRDEYDKTWLAKHNLSVPMISDYLPVAGDDALAIEKATALCLLCQRWGAKKLRTFAGGKPSADVSLEERKTWIIRMRKFCQLLDDYGLSLIVETHPNTLADTLNSTLQLIDEVNHPALRINFDVIHVWESGDDPYEAAWALEPFISHLHLKNVARRESLSVFTPANVYAPAGDRDGMVRLFDGEFDFKPFLKFIQKNTQLPWDTLDASLEWFGRDVLSTLEQDYSDIKKIGLAEYKMIPIRETVSNL